jgi:hypothetical protein
MRGRDDRRADDVGRTEAAHTVHRRLPRRRHRRAATQIVFVPISLSMTFFSLRAAMAHADKAGSLHVLVISWAAGLLAGSFLWRRVFRRCGVRGMLVMSGTRARRGGVRRPGGGTRHDRPGPGSALASDDRACAGHTCDHRRYPRTRSAPGNIASALEAGPNRRQPLDQFAFSDYAAIKQRMR